MNPVSLPARGAAEAARAVLQVLYVESDAEEAALTRHLCGARAPWLQLNVVTTLAAARQQLAAAASGGVWPDLWLIDRQLPDGDGLDLLIELRRAAAPVAVVLITGPADPLSAAAALRAGADDCIVKVGDYQRRLPDLLDAALQAAHRRVQLERERAALHESETRFRQMAEAIRDVFWLSDPLRNCVLYVNPAFERLSGCSAEEVYADPAIWLRTVHPEDRERVAEVFTDSQRSTDWAIEFRVLSPDLGLRHIHMRGYAVRDAAGRLMRRAGLAQDVTEQKLQEQRVQHLAYHDALTGLPNRMLVTDRLARGLVVAQRQGSQLALLFMDLDRFKTINDTLGHLSGDSLLCQVARRLQACLREQDTVARLGGDEFLVLLEHVSEIGDVAHVANKILAAMVAPFKLGEHELHVSLSIGISVYPRDGADAESLLKYADTALYRAKDAGRNTYRFFSPEMDAHAQAQLLLEAQLRRALERGEFELHYQPQFDLGTGGLGGIEALLRWHHPQRGLLAPAEFIGVAEDSGLIVPIGAWALQQACAQAQRWRAAGHDLRVAVNVAGLQLRRPGLLAVVHEALDRSGLPPERLELEMSETSVMAIVQTERRSAAHGADRESGASGELLHQLRALGVQLSMDDFGTGYSSLAQLKRLPLQRLKIDHRFIQCIDTSDEDEAIVAAILAMAHQLHLRVVAEGVETDAQVRRLVELGCDEAQGHMLGMPMDAVALGRLLDEYVGPEAPAGHGPDVWPDI